MNGYILSVLGIVLLGVIIDIIVPNGNINKYIKSIYAIFVVAVIISPITKILKYDNDFSINYRDYEISQNLLNYIYSARVDSLENELIDALEKEGISKITININYSSENNELVYHSCVVDLKNMVISLDKQHINSYEYITRLINATTGLNDEEIIFNE
ncbi:MAG: stage III sporulation protein AF [Clostridia bacterium]